MKTLWYSVAVSLGMIAGAAQAEQMVTVDGTEYPLSVLMGVCQSMTDNPTGQIACFSDVARLLEEQSVTAPQANVSVSEALEALRTVAQYQDDVSGLAVQGADCTIQVLYYNNYFHISRRNISEIDLFNAKFDASKLQYDQIVMNKGGPAPLSTGVLDAGTVATMHGGAGLDSGNDGFSARPPGTALDVFANEVVNQLPTREGQTFDFVLVHPQRSADSAAIWKAFEVFAKACRG